MKLLGDFCGFVIESLTNLPYNEYVGVLPTNSFVDCYSEFKFADRKTNLKCAQVQFQTKTLLKFKLENSKSPCEAKIIRVEFLSCVA